MSKFTRSVQAAFETNAELFTLIPESSEWMALSNGCFFDFAQGEHIFLLWLGEGNRDGGCGVGSKSTGLSVGKSTAGH